MISVLIPRLSHSLGARYIDVHRRSVNFPSKGPNRRVVRGLALRHEEPSAQDRARISTSPDRSTVLSWHSAKARGPVAGFLFT